MPSALPGSCTGGRTGTIVCALPNFVRLTWRVILRIGIVAPLSENERAFRMSLDCSHAEHFAAAGPVRRHADDQCLDEDMQRQGRLFAQ
jgi:hypothetical protein